jgi:hypothetical protein
VAAGGAAITGNSTLLGTLGGLTALAVSPNGADITGDSKFTGALTVTKGVAVTGNSTVTGTLTVSSTIGAAAGTKAGLAVIYDQFPVTLSASGSADLPSGLQLRWGNGSVGGAGTTPVSFPSAFTSGCLQVVVSPTYGGGGTPGSVTAAAGSLTAAGFNLGSSAALGYSYLAIGY